MTHSQECSLIRVDPVPTFCHHLISTKRTNYTTFSSGIIKKRKEKTPFLFVFHVSYTRLFLTHNILRLSAVTDGSQTNVLETCSTAIITVNAVRNSKSHIYIYIYILPKNQSIHHCLVPSGLWVNKEVWKWDQNVIRSVQPVRSYMIWVQTTANKVFILVYAQL